MGEISSNINLREVQKTVVLVIAHKEQRVLSA